ncbi:hypothetical protein F5Y18DRAFT_397997 [Xylariaceae sp. FL1019]|nr:hypothetical protein F5Y18DRAFT_397997 [Xylariaceae sp. FL1019]
MFSQKDIKDASEQLVRFNQTNALGDILQKYEKLLVEHSKLKSTHEEDQIRLMQLSRGQEPDPFVLVLIDGDGYIFNDRFITAGADGGSLAAQKLNNAIECSLKRKGLEFCSVMIRVYANLSFLSKSLAKKSLAGPEKRSLAPFVSEFNRSYELTDFVDAGELKEGADFKLRALLRLYADKPECKHIYFAACHDGGYISDLTKHRAKRDKFTLIKSSGLLFHEQFSRLELNIEELPGIFLSTSLDEYNRHSRPQARTNSESSLLPIDSSLLRVGSAPDKSKICSFYAIGKCRYGNICKNKHVDPKSPVTGSSHKFRHSFRANSETEFKHSLDYYKPASPRSSTNWREQAPLAMHQTIQPPFNLPQKEQIPPGHVALNKDNQRLDPYMSSPTAAAHARLEQLSLRRRFCNSHQLTQSCTNEGCNYDHDPLPKDLIPVLWWLARSLPCGKKDRCRNPACTLGHVCQYPDCRHRGGKASCRLPPQAHIIDFQLYEAVSVSGTSTPPSEDYSPSTDTDTAPGYGDSLRGENDSDHDILGFRLEPGLEDNVWDRL